MRRFRRKRGAIAAFGIMAGFAAGAALASDEAAFLGSDVLNGVRGDAAVCDGPGRLWLEIDGQGDCLRFYGVPSKEAGGPPIVFLEGDDVQPGTAPRWQVSRTYQQLSPVLLQREAEQYSAAAARPFVNLARPGIHGSSGNHMQRRREREVALVDAAVTRLSERYGWTRVSLAGLSGGGHLVAALMARRSDVDCAVIASGNVAVRERLRERGLEIDVTGYGDFVDPAAFVAEVARHPPRKVIMLTDPLDAVVSASSQGVYAAALRDAGVEVEQRFVTAARDPTHHFLRFPALLAAFACGAP